MLSNKEKRKRIKELIKQKRMTKSKMHIVAVYGTLRKGGSNDKFLKTGDYLGEFETNPVFNLYSVGGSFPALALKGTTSVKMEVYKVDDLTMSRVNGLEGYSEERPNSGMYTRKMIYTPYGEAYVFVYNQSVNGLQKITGGDWIDYVDQLPLTRILNNA